MVVYLEYKKAGKLPPHVIPAFHVYVHAVKAGVNLEGYDVGTVARIANKIVFVDSYEEAIALEQVKGCTVRWSD